ncbi:hypothetical protein MLD38_011326 [Melastoma candidum]|uniref:Uncharacterized protein n=1 Tax=Melastoma candidum TaxID=119954 RepID=A0ACB9R2P3_9MYRT|nr:hypothetical protein MLD38_011326 [Melastoma candidum]
MSASSVLAFLVLVSVSGFQTAASGDADALLALKASVDPQGLLPWPGAGNDACLWRGVKDCLNGRITKLVLEYLNLTGRLDSMSLSRLDQLRVLSFKGNSISGDLPDLSSLVNLKSVYLNDNDFTGTIPASLDSLHRLKVVVLSGNRISGEIPESLVRLPRLYILFLQDNKLSGKIPGLNQTSLRYFNVSNNQLSGEIPATPALLRFNSSSFSGNLQLCGEQAGNPCAGSEPPAASPSGATPATKARHHGGRRRRLIAIIAGTVGGFLVAVGCVICCAMAVWWSRGKGRGGGEGAEEEEGGRGKKAGRGEEAGEGSGEKQVGFSWEGGEGGIGSLVFLGAGDQQMSYSLEDLLKASAETLGRGTLGSTYKAVMESGYIVTVKRLRDARYPRIDEFRRRMEVIGSLTHPNLVPLRAYFQAKEERLLVYDYFPNGSLFTLIHGSRTSGSGKPLHWTSCLKIAEDLATGLLYIHSSHGLAHGNLKSSNVLLGSDFESCITDYGLTCFRDPESFEEPSAASLFYRAPECRDPRSPVTQQADIYSYGVLLLELLTGKTPFQDLVQEHGSDIPRWVKSVREEETESGEDPASSNEASEEKLQALLNIAMACVCLAPENRPTVREVLKMVRDARSEAQVSSNSSEHSPGRWSDTVQSLPREEHLSI